MTLGQLYNLAKPKVDPPQNHQKMYDKNLKIRLTPRAPTGVLPLAVLQLPRPLLPLLFLPLGL